ncbi:MAG: hypothetical protein ACTSUU_06820 [Candidatus Thorarchaeota archaeon]
MAITVVDSRTEFDGADAVTGWTGSPTLFTSEPTPKELSGCLGIQVSNESLEFGHQDTGGIDLSDLLVYIWVLGQGIMDTKANHGITAYFTDGTNEIGYDISGSDEAVFRHNSGQPLWQCMVIDPDDPPTDFIEYSGSETSLDWSAIEVIGAGFKTLVKSVGGVENCFIDTIRYGSDGIYCYGGTGGAPEVFETIASEDASNTSGKAYGIFRKLGTQLFGLQGVLEIGDATSTNDTYLTDTGFTINIEDVGVGVSRSGVRFQNNSTGAGIYNITDGNFICPVGVGAFFDASNADIGLMLLQRLNFVNFDQGMKFATGGGSHFIRDNNFDNCAQVDPGDTTFEGNTFINCADADGALLLDATGSTKWADLLFTRGTETSHAIYITATGTHVLDNITYSGYGADATTTAAVYNNSGGAVTLNITGGGDAPTVLNGASASTSIINAKYLAVRVKSATTLVNISGARVYLEAAAGGPLTEGTVILNGATSLGIIEITDFNYISDQPVTGRVRKSTSSPLYKTGVLAGSITSDGYDVTVYLVDDE